MAHTEGSYVRGTAELPLSDLTIAALLASVEKLVIAGGA